MTMANAAVSSPQRTTMSIRKTNKPLMEKRRRARINDSLTQLKSLVIQSNKKDSAQFNKLEKADILELTVKYLRNLQDTQKQQQLSQANSDASLAGKYQAGFMECANEVIRYLGQTQTFSDDLKSRVIHHLAGCIQLSSKIPLVKPLQSNAPTAANPLPAGSGHLVSGQVVQVVSGHFPNMKPSLPGSLTSGGQSVAMGQLPSTPTQIPISITSVPTTTVATPTTEPPSFLKYAQPLQIQIPSVVSPVIIRANPTHQQKADQTYLIYKVKESEPMTKSQDRVSNITNSKQETFLSSHPPSPYSKEISTSPVPLLPCQNSHKYFSQDSHFSDFLPRSRTYSLTSSSSETELSSPLNLSQSPQYYDHRELSTQNLSSTGKQIPQASVHSHKLSTTHPAAERQLSSISPSSSFTSVIVDGRNTVGDSHLMKYMQCMDYERRYTQYELAVSPASSVGEERLWRPW